LIVPAKTPSALAAAIRKLVSDTPLRQSLGTSAAEYTRRVFSLEACVASYVRVLGIG
jgi:glycosyltransferase involved in cell wall biosynthesis